MSGKKSPVEDGKSAVAGTGGRNLSARAKAGIAVLVGVLGLGFIWFQAYYASTPRQEKAAASDETYSNRGEQYAGPPPVAMKPPPASLPQPAPAAPAPSPLFGMAPGEKSPAAAPILAFSGQTGAAAVPAVAAHQPATSPAAAAPEPKDASPLAERLKPTLLSGESAAILKHPNLTITEGTLIPCILQTAISSELPGLVSCVVPTDIRGTSGTVVLLDRGTKIVGQIQKGLLQGQNRVFVDWTRAETPAHVIITLDSPGADELGRAGLPGAVDNHWWERFGGALMLTLVQGVLDAATVEAAGQSTSSTAQEAGLGFVFAAQSNGQSVANTALENSISIPPTLTKNQGETVSLIVAHDLDFSDVYRLEVNAAEPSPGG